MKKFIAIAALFLFSLGSFAQKGGTPSEKAQKMADKMKTELELTDDQHASVHKILLNSFTEAQNIRKSDKSKEDQKAELKTKRQEANNQLKEVLSEDQFKRYKEFMKEQKENHKKGK